MIKNYIVFITLLSVLLVSCSKTENVSVDYPYIIDEEFLNNDNGWVNIDTSNSSNSYFQKIVSEGNGLYSLVYFSLFGSPTNLISTIDVGLNDNKNYIIESSFTFDNETHPTATQNSATKPGGIVFSVTNEQNFYKIGAGYDNSSNESNLYIQRSINNSIDNIIDPIPLELSNPVLTIKVEKTTHTNNLNTFNVIVNGELITTIDSLELNNGASVGIHSNKGTAINYHYLRVRQEP